jgi:hypothetical protein
VSFDSSPSKSNNFFAIYNGYNVMFFFAELLKFFHFTIFKELFSIYLKSNC